MSISIQTAKLALRSLRHLLSFLTSITHTHTHISCLAGTLKRAYEHKYTKFNMEVADMYEVTVLNLLTKATFIKTFASPFLARKFLAKAKRSKKIRVIGTSGFIG